METLAAPQGNDLDTNAFVAGLEHMLRGLDGVPNTPELQQLNRQGVGRFMGALSTCRLFGLIESTDIAASVESQGMEPEQLLTLGLQKGLYRFTGDPSHMGKLVEHTSTRRTFCQELGGVEQPGDLQALVDVVQQTLIALGEQVSNLHTKSGGGSGRSVHGRA